MARVLKRVEIVFYIEVDQGPSHKVDAQVADMVRLDGGSMVDHARITEATKEGVTKDGWEDYEVYGADGDKKAGSYLQ